MQPFQLRVAALRWFPTPEILTERNIRNVLLDRGIGVGLVSGVATFLPVFLARLGASSLLVGMLTLLSTLTGAVYNISQLVSGSARLCAAYCVGKRL